MFGISDMAPRIVVETMRDSGQKDRMLLTHGRGRVGVVTEGKEKQNENVGMYRVRRGKENLEYLRDPSRMRLQLLYTIRITVIHVS